MNSFQICFLAVYKFSSGPFLPSKAYLPIFNKFFLSVNNNFKEAIGMMKGWLTACGECIFTVLVFTCGISVFHCMFLLFGGRPTSPHCSGTGAQSK